MSTEYETMMLQKYDPLLRSIARRFMTRSWRYDQGRSEFDDLYQAARLGFVEDMRRSDFNPDAIGFARGILSRLYECSRNNAIVYVPIGRYCREIDRFSALPYDGAHEHAGCPSFECDAATNIDFENWIESLDAEARAVARHICAGESLRSLSAGATPAAQRRLSSARHRIRRQYNNMLRAEARADAAQR